MCVSSSTDPDMGADQGVHAELRSSQPGGQVSADLERVPEVPQEPQVPRAGGGRRLQAGPRVAGHRRDDQDCHVSSSIYCTGRQFSVGKTRLS